MNETVFYQSDGVMVTNARFVVGDQTYAMSGVTSVSRDVTNPNRLNFAIGIGVGLLLMLASEGIARLLGLLIAAGCAFAIWNKKPAYAVMLRTSSGEQQALSSLDRAKISAIIAALNQALVSRG